MISDKYLSNGYIFNIVLFLTLAAPHKSLTTFKVPAIGFLSTVDIGLMLLPVIYLFYQNYIPQKRTLIIVGLLLFISIFIVESLKGFLFDGLFKNGFKLLRDWLLPLMSAYLIFSQGIKLKSHIVLKFFLLALNVSFIASLFMAFYNISYSITGVDQEFSILNNGRIINMNAYFSLIGLYLLFNVSKYSMSIRLSRLIILTSVLSLIISILSFNRTLLVLLVLELILLMYNYGIRRNVLILTLKFIMITFGFLVIFYNIYTNNDTIRDQVDTRILSFVDFSNDGWEIYEDDFVDSAWEGNRDFMITAAITKGLSNPFLGTPYALKIWESESGLVGNSVDISTLHVFAKHGFIVLILFVTFYMSLFIHVKNSPKKMNISGLLLNSLSFSLPFYFLLSLNANVLLLLPSFYLVFLSNFQQD